MKLNSYLSLFERIATALCLLLSPCILCFSEMFVTYWSSSCTYYLFAVVCFTSMFYLILPVIVPCFVNIASSKFGSSFLKENIAIRICLLLTSIFLALLVSLFYC